MTAGFIFAGFEVRSNKTGGHKTAPTEERRSEQ
jgi:hypothetical protein